MYWRDIDYIGPRRTPVRPHRNHNLRETERFSREDDGRVMIKPQTAKTTVAVPEPQAPAEKITSKDHVAAVDEVNWQQKALKLQAEMDNFRKRQERRAEESTANERERLIGRFLPVLDNLSRALAHQPQAGEDQTEILRQGVELTQRELLRILEGEGVVPLETVGQPFDPEWHEAIATIPAEVEPGTVVEQVETGYKVGDKLLRPAKVVVAA